MKQTLTRFLIYAVLIMIIAAASGSPLTGSTLSGQIGYYTGRAIPLIFLAAVFEAIYRIARRNRKQTLPEVPPTQPFPASHDAMPTRPLDELKRP